LTAPVGRRRFIGAATALLATGASWDALAKSPPRIGWLKIQGPRHSPDQLQAFRAGMHELGMVEGRDYALEERYANGKGALLPSLAAELVTAGVSIILATSQPSIAAAARVTRSVPVIGRMNDDPVANGMARSLAHPGGNVTGIYALAEKLNPKRLSLLKNVVPSLRRVGVLLRRDWSNAAHDWQVLEKAGRELKLELLELNARSADDLTAAFEEASAKRIDGLMTFRNPTVVTYLKLIVALCREHRLPAVFDAGEYVAAGGLMSYGPNIDTIYRQLATYASRLLRGALPSDLPIEQPTQFELVINLKTADALGLAIPKSVLLRADRVIE